MSNNIFSRRRFALLFRQHIIHNSQLLALSIVAYIGVVFIVLALAQLGSELRPHDLENFQIFLVGFVLVFGILYVGHSFPAFRAKESTINYLMVPASVLEKFAFEFISRIVLMILILPILYWATFHLQGYFFSIFTDAIFQPIGIQHLVKVEVPDPDYEVVIYTLIFAGALLAFVLAFTGGAMFTKQPLVKSLFAVAVIVMFFMGYSYIVVTYLGVEDYHPPETMMLMPMRDERALLQLISVGLIITTIVMLFVAFRKLKEREV